MGVLQVNFEHIESEIFNSKGKISSLFFKTRRCLSELKLDKGLHL